MRSFEAWAKEGNFWGKVKTDKSTGEVLAWLPLRQHCIDVAEAVYQLAKAPYAREKLSQLAGRELNDIDLQRLAVFAAMHDLGKLSLGFQSKIFGRFPLWPVQGHTEEALRTLLSGEPNAAAVASRLPLDDFAGWLTAVASEDAVCEMLNAVWSHHGMPVRVVDQQLVSKKNDALWSTYERLCPADELARIVDACRLQFPLAWSQNTKPLPCTRGLTHYLAGLVMLGDWLASNQEFFPLTGNTMSDEQRIEYARARIAKLLADNLLAGQWPSAGFNEPGGLSFKKLFGDREARPLQKAVEVLDVSTPGARTLVAESDTGSGKTEAALLWWAKLRAAGHVQGLYFALPTRVSARELYLRVCSFVAQAYPEGQRPQVLLAVPGYVKMSENCLLPDESNLHNDDANLAALAKVWAGEHAKRFLAAPIVVGTVDQALLAMLQTKHAHLRNTLLERHLLVVDEVHASDEYMQSVLVDLLKHRRAQGCWNLLLSATLGNSARAKLLEAGRGQGFTSAASQPYPLLSGEKGLQVAVTGESRQKTVRVTSVPLMGNLERLAADVTSAVHSGARVLVVMNTVARANKMQKLVEERLGTGHPALFRVCGVPCPHHGRFAAQDREVMDAAVQAFLGAKSGSGARVLVGTQTLEQSLDIDADVLFTDLCPMDVLLQRIGRLWRHDRTDRPAAWSTGGVAQCFLIVPPYALDAAVASKERLSELMKSGLGSVYTDLRIADLTWRYFEQESSELEIPRDNRDVVEYATNEEQLDSFGANWGKRVAAVTGKQVQDRSAARDASARGVYRASFGSEECVFSATDATTRLGEGSWLLPLAVPVTSPFGQALSSLQVSQRVLQLESASEVIEATKQPARVLSVDEAGLELLWAGKHVRYDRLGVALV